MRALLKLFQRPAPNPWPAVHGALDTLERNARLRADTRALHRLRAARVTLVQEALRPVPPDA